MPRSTLEPIHEEVERESSRPTKRLKLDWHCKDCAVGFTLKKAYLRHCRESRTHKAIMRNDAYTTNMQALETHVCPRSDCNKSFTRHYDLLRHIREVHENATRTTSRNISEFASAATSGLSTPLPELVAESTKSQIASEFLLPECGSRSVSVDRADEAVDKAASSSLGGSAGTSLFPFEPAVALTLPEDPSSEVDDWIQMTFERLCLSDSFEIKAHSDSDNGSQMSLLKECPICSAMYSIGDDLLRCMQAHKSRPVRIHICSACDIGFFRADHLQIHQRNAAQHSHCGFDFEHHCRGHHPTGGDNTSHERMEVCYLLQLDIKAEKRASTLQTRDETRKLQRRWSFTGLRRRASTNSLATSLNTWWSTPLAAAHLPDLQIRQRLMETLRASELRALELCKAIESQEFGRVLRLINQGVDLNPRWVTQDQTILKKDQSILAFAIAQQAPYVVLEVLLDAGSHCRFEKVPALASYLPTLEMDEACNAHMLWLVRILLENGANLDDIHYYNAMDPAGLLSHLCAAALLGNKSMVSYLIGRNVKIDDDSSNTFGSALCCAAAKGCVAIAELLLKAGASLDQQSPSAATSLDLAAASGNESMFKLLLSAGADINGPDHPKANWEAPFVKHEKRFTSSPLMQALSCGRTNIAVMIMTRGASAGTAGEAFLWTVETANTTALATFLQAEKILARNEPNRATDVWRDEADTDRAMRHATRCRQNEILALLENDAGDHWRAIRAKFAQYRKEPDHPTYETYIKSTPRDFTDVSDDHRITRLEHRLNYEQIVENDHVSDPRTRTDDFHNFEDI